jgi:predicted nucleic acid-binding protein
MNVDIFVDTNILVYAHDREAGERHAVAKGLIGDFWEKRQTPCVSIQSRPWRARFHPRRQQWQLSIWDALIVAAARQSGVSTLWSEDLNEGQEYGGVRIVNPLKER